MKDPPHPSTPSEPADSGLPSLLSLDRLSKAIPGYRFDALLGAGGMGVVYRAWQHELERSVAVKLFFDSGRDDDHGERSERFRVEARAMAKLHHPNIVAVHEFGESEIVLSEGSEPASLLFLVMEFVEGRDLAQLLAENAAVDPGQAIRWLLGVVQALAYAHEQGIVHRDIKPANILIATDGSLKVADFGLAKLLDDDPFATQLTLTQTSMGTVDYAAPEQLDAGQTVDHRADIYSVGVLLYQLLGGALPRGAFRPLSERRPELDPRLDGIVERALHPDPKERLPSMAAFLEALEPFRDSGGVRIPSSRAPRRHWGWWLGGLVAVVSVALAWNPFDSDPTAAQEFPGSVTKTGTLRSYGSSLSGGPPDLEKARGLSDFESVAMTPLGDWAALREQGGVASNDDAFDQLADVTQVAAGFGGLLAVKASGQLLAGGVLGDTTLIQATGVSQVAAGSHVAVLYRSGDVDVWEYGATGWSYPGDPSRYRRQETPLEDVVSLAANWMLIVAVHEDGSLSARQHTSAWAHVVDRGRFQAVAAGGQHFLAIHEDGTVWRWLWPLTGELSTPERVPEVGERPVGALRASSSVAAIQLKDGSWVGSYCDDADKGDAMPGLVRQIGQVGAVKDMSLFFSPATGALLWIAEGDRKR